MQDAMIRATLMKGQALVLMASSTQMVEKARQIHHTTPVCTAALGRLLTGTALMSGLLKSQTDRLTVTLGGNGPAGRVVCAGFPGGLVKGYVDHPQADLPLKPNGKLDVGGVVGNQGRLAVVRDLGLKEPYVGQTNLVSGEVAEDLAMYFTASEQTPSLVALGVLTHPTSQEVLGAGGVLVQAMPGCEESLLQALELRAPVLADISRHVAYEDDLDGLARMFFHDLDLDILDHHQPQWFCDCTRERIEGALISLGDKELTQMLDEDGQAEVTCHFCHNTYHFTAQDLMGLRDEAMVRGE